MKRYSSAVALCGGRVPPPVKDTATGLRDAKGSAYEGGVRVQVIFAGAGVTPVQYRGARQPARRASRSCGHSSPAINFRPDRSPVSLGSLPWLQGTNNGTGNAATREVSTFSQAQLENSASRLYLGVHFGYDNLQGQLLGLAVADALLVRSSDPAAEGIVPSDSEVSLSRLERTLVHRPRALRIVRKRHRPSPNQVRAAQPDLHSLRRGNPAGTRAADVSCIQDDEGLEERDDREATSTG